MNYLTKKQVFAQFKELYADVISSGDEPARDQEWNDYVDSLIKAHEVHPVRAYRWTHPYN